MSEMSPMVKSLVEAEAEIERLQKQLGKAQAALHQILAIEDSYNGSDWCEINEARDIANGALTDD